jgi:hypothetical protein
MRHESCCKACLVAGDKEERRDIVGVIDSFGIIPPAQRNLCVRGNIEEKRREGVEEAGSELYFSSRCGGTNARGKRHER